MGYIYYHGSHTAVFSYKDQKFILSTAHYADSRSANQWAREQLAAVADAQAAFSTPLPVILTGDMYTSFNSSSSNSGYNYLASNGYKDAQRYALVNANRNTSYGTFHNIGERQSNRISEDFVWYTKEMQALCFKVLSNKISDDASDHYPVMADLKFN
jgi:endonuclease/exonuclease/phosphatase family metal-dependent hydrolase